MSAHTELAARMPWTVAEPESWWLITGTYGKGRGTFTDCIARVLPDYVSGTDAPVFEVLVYGDSGAVPASAITTASELVFVLADDPATAYYLRDQPTIDASHD